MAQEGGAACRTGSELTFSSNSSEWVPSTGFQDLEHLEEKAEGAFAQLLHELPQG